MSSQDYPSGANAEGTAWRFQTAPAARQMDPRLQRVCLRRLAGLSEAATASTLENEINVVAKVTEVGAWTERTDVRLGQVIGGHDGETAIVTGRVPVQRLEKLRA